MIVCVEVRGGENSDTQTDVSRKLSNIGRVLQRETLFVAHTTSTKDNVRVRDVFIFRVILAHGSCWQMGLNDDVAGVDRPVHESFRDLVDHLE